MLQRTSFHLLSDRFKKLNFYAFPALVIFFVAQFAYSQTAPEAAELELGKPIEREISGGQKHEYKVGFASAQFARLAVEQRGIDIIVRLLDANGKVLIHFDSEPRNNGEEPIVLYAENAGDLRLSVEPRQKSARAGRYEIRLLEQRSATAKDIALDESRKLLTEANRLWIAGKYAEALPIAERTLSIRERELGAEHADVATAVFVLGNIVGDMGDLVKCEEFYARALEIREKALGKNHPTLASIFMNWGVIYKIKGDYVKAEALYTRALEIWEASLEPNHLLLASVLSNLGSVNLERGNREQAALLYRRALTIRENALGPEHPDVATTLNNIANLYDDVTTTEPLYLRSLSIREKAFGPEHQDVAQSLYNLARLYSSFDDYQKAKSFCQRSLAIFEKTLGAEHAFVSYPLNLLAIIYKNLGDYNQSESLFLRAAALKEKTQGAFHPELGGTYSNLANLYALKGEIEKAVAAQTRANEILEYNTALNLTIGSERDKLDYLKSLKEIEYKTLTLNFKTAPDSAAATNLAVTSILRRKGRVLDAMSDSFGALRRRFDTQDRLLLDRLNEATAQLVGFVSEGGQSISSDAYRQKLKSLEQQRESIENQISRRSAGFYESNKTLTLNEIQAAIPAKTALVEFAVYRPTSFKDFEFETERALDTKAAGDSRYAVFVINAKGEVRSKDLGLAQDIDASVNAFRQALSDPKRGDVQRLARAADEKIMQPVRALLGDAEHLLVSPDGTLNLIPFEALMNERSRYLVEQYSFTYLSSGRDLLRMKTPRESKNKFLIIANPSFGESSAQADASSNENAKSNVRRRTNKRQSITATRDLSETYFTPLGGTLQEARLIKSLFPEAEFLTGAQATETALKQTTAPRILHIATHGFFLEDAKTNSGTNSKSASRNAEANTKIENPLLRSGLALAGANQRGGVKDDGILTALEASGLNLWGTKLVVLSACDTGIGEVKNGEGVYGLRRAFILAGAESIVMSLWSVSDFETRKLMTSYYKNLKQGTGRGAALRQVQLEILKGDEQRHPFYWAGFIQSGEWANLDGTR